MLGGLTYPFIEPPETTELIEDLISLYKRLIDLGFEYRNGKVYLADLEDRNV